MLGINIGLKAKLFPNRDYKNLKKKFKDEEKNNPDRIESAVESHIPFDPSYFSGDSGTILHCFFRIFLIILSVCPAFIPVQEEKQTSPTEMEIVDQPSNLKKTDSAVPSRGGKKAGVAKQVKM